jgi:glycosyltransferase involved in cell wall biosynthesis
MNLFIFSNFFPYKKAEAFLLNEFEFTKKEALSINLISLYGKHEESLIKEESNLKLLKPIINNSSSKIFLLFKGVFNLAPVNFHLNEFIKTNILLSPQKLYYWFISLFISRAALSSDAYKQLVKLVNASKNPILYFYWGDNLAWTIPYLKKEIKNKDLKIIIRLHGSDLYENLKHNYAPLRSAIFSAADTIVPISEHGYNYIFNKYPKFSSKVFLSRLGVFDNGLNYNIQNLSKEFTIVSVSNVVALKRLNLLFDALQKTQSNITWHHFGDGVLMNDLNNSIKNKRQGLNVILHGYVSNQTLINFYQKQQVDLFVNVSSSEGLPVSIMEALSFAIPVIATDVGGSSELVSDKVGELISSNFSTESLGQNIEKVLNLNSEELLLLRSNARSIFELKVNAKINYLLFYNKIKN